MMTSNRITATAAALAALGLLGAGLPGCSAKVEKSPPSVGAADLQKQLTDQLSGADPAPKSVTCKDDLVGQVGKTASCEVKFDDTTTVEAVVTVTSVEGDNVSYDVAPALTKEQLATSVSAMAGATSAVCATGLEGKVGATAQCEVTDDGVTTKRMVEVDGVSGMSMDYSVRRVVPKEEVQSLLIQKLSADGTPVETVECVDDAVAKQGANVECVTVTGNQKKGYVVTVTTVEDDKFDIDYQDAP